MLAAMDHHTDDETALNRVLRDRFADLTEDIPESVPGPTIAAWEDVEIDTRALRRVLPACSMAS